MAELSNQREYGEIQAKRHGVLNCLNIFVYFVKLMPKHEAIMK